MSAPQATPPSLPAGAVEILYDEFLCWFLLMLSRQWPLYPSFSVGCGFEDCPNYCAHKGIDLFYPSGVLVADRACPAVGVGLVGENVRPAFGGCPHQGTPNKAKVIFAGSTTSGGNTVILEHLDETHRTQFRTTYLHLNSIYSYVTAGAFLTTSQAIGTTGKTGDANNFPHLHFEINFRRSDSPHWRTVAERALMPASLISGRPVSDPELILPPLAGDALLIVTEPPPPAYEPPRGSLELPRWRPFPHLPMVGDLGAGLSVSGYYGGFPAWEAGIRMTVPGTLIARPFLDAPDGVIYVAGTGEGSNYYSVTLLHSDTRWRTMILTYYTFYNKSSATLLVSQGDFINTNTQLASITSAATKLIEWGVYSKSAANAKSWATTEPIDLDAFDPWGADAGLSIHPACYLQGQVGWTNWPPGEYPGCP